MCACLFMGIIVFSFLINKSKGFLVFTLLGFGRLSYLLSYLVTSKNHKIFKRKIVSSYCRISVTMVTF